MFFMHVLACGPKAHSIIIDFHHSSLLYSILLFSLILPLHSLPEALFLAALFTRHWRRLSILQAQTVLLLLAINQKTLFIYSTPLRLLWFAQRQFSERARSFLFFQAGKST